MCKASDDPSCRPTGRSGSPRRRGAFVGAPGGLLSRQEGMRRCAVRGALSLPCLSDAAGCRCAVVVPRLIGCGTLRSEEHTSELQSLMRISYAVFCLKKKKKQIYKQLNQVIHD